MQHWKITLVAALAALPPAASAQVPSLSLDNLEQRLIDADEQSLRDIAPYLDSNKPITITLGYHLIQTTEAEVARRILSENTALLADEIVLDETLTTAAWLRMLDQHPLHHSALADTFLHTPISDRDTPYRLEVLSTHTLATLGPSVEQLTPLLDANNQQLLHAHDPRVLLGIAAQLYQDRDRWDHYQANDEGLITMLRLLTRTDLYVPDQAGEIQVLSHRTYGSARQLSALVYWSNHHTDYRWDDAAGHFVNVAEPVTLPSQASENVRQLSSAQPAVAHAAFRALATSDPEAVQEALRQLASLERHMNRDLGSFAFSFLRQLPAFTAYCRQHGHDYTGSKALRADLARLRTDLPFAERYALENDLAARVTLDELTAIEFDALLQPGYRYTYSVGRILDKAYSRLWSALAKDEAQLRLYLYKSHWFQNLGIIGFCNEYLAKFRAPHPQMQAALHQLETDDETLRAVVGRAQEQARLGGPPAPPAFQAWDGHHSDTVDEPLAQLAPLMVDTAEHKRPIADLLSRLRYEQIAEVLPVLQRNGFASDRDLHHFIEDDFGIPLNLYPGNNLDIFVSRYGEMTEAELYRSYLRDIHPEALTRGGQLDLDVADEMLAFDSTTAFVGGGGGERDTGLYLVIKLLELEHGTRLGYPPKKCNAASLYGCSITQQARSWRRHLADAGSVTPDASVPPSYSAFR